MSMPAKDSVATLLETARLACAARGARLTELRRTVLELLLEADGPVTAYQLLDRLREGRDGAAPPTVYRALDFLIEQKLVHRVERLNAFVACNDSGHEHAVQFLICRRCGTVAEIEDRGVREALEHAAELKGFQPGSAVVELDGTCAECAGI